MQHIRFGKSEKGARAWHIRHKKETGYLKDVKRVIGKFAKIPTRGDERRKLRKGLKRLGLKRKDGRHEVKIKKQGNAGKGGLFSLYKYGYGGTPQWTALRQSIHKSCDCNSPGIAAVRSGDAEKKYCPYWRSTYGGVR